jgi:hypothetical protein
LANLYGTGDSCSAYGNRNFWRIFRDWFGSTYADDTYTPHPNGSVVSDGYKVYLIDNGVRRHIISPSVFLANNYKWSQVKPTSSGDTSLPISNALSTIPAGTLFHSGNSPVYVMEYENSILKKKPVSLSAFQQMGFSWNEVFNLSASEVPAPTSSSTLFSGPHPSGTLISYQSKVYLIDKGYRRYIPNASVFISQGYDWAKIKPASSADIALPAGSNLSFRAGSVFHAAGIYVIDVDQNGAFKRPVGPWECYVDRWHYATSDWTFVTIDSLPARNGPTATC